MTEFGLFQLVILPLGLGLLGFVEPCSIGSSLVFIKYIEGQSAAARIAQVGVFALTRALLIGALGALAALIGTIFLSLQKGAWLLLGLFYIAIGAFYALGKAGSLMRSFGPSLSRLVGLRVGWARPVVRAQHPGLRGPADLRAARQRGPRRQ
jgi:cytochrome c-type biogenesis protein